MRHRIDTLVSLAAGLAHAGLMAVAFAPVEFGWAALVTIVPLVWVALRLTRGSASDEASRTRARLAPARCRKRDAVMVGLGASAFYWWQQQWVMDISAAGYVPLVVYLAIYPGLFVLLLSRLHGRFPRVPLAVLVPIVWTGLEWIRGEVVWDGYAWFLLGHPLIDTPIASAGSVVGAYGVGALVCGLVGAVSGVSRTCRKSTFVIEACLGATIIASVALIAFSAATQNGWASKVAYADFRRLSVVQTNLPQSNKIGWSAEQRERDFKRFLDLTRRAASEEALGPHRLSPREAEVQTSVVIWPETMFPGYFLEPLQVTSDRGEKEFRRTRFSERLLDLQRELKVPFLIGALGTDNLRLSPGPDGGRVEYDKRFNSVFLIDGGDISGSRYDKIRLTPFGETMPYVSAWPWLEKKLLSIGAAGMTFDLARGDELRADGFWIETPDETLSRPGIKWYRGVKLVTPICFEVTETALCRRLVTNAAKDGAAVILVNVTNDGWFGDWDAGRMQHALAARWRSIELGVSMVRAANTGISGVEWFGFSDGYKPLRIEGRSSRVEGVLVADVPVVSEATFYRKVGDLCWVFPLTLAGLVILAIVRKQPNNQGDGSGTETAKAA